MERKYLARVGKIRNVRKFAYTLRGCLFYWTFRKEFGKYNIPVASGSLWEFKPEFSVERKVLLESSENPRLNAGPFIENSIL